MQLKTSCSALRTNNMNLVFLELELKVEKVGLKRRYPSVIYP